MFVPNKEIMARNIKYYMELNNKTATEVCADLHIKHNTFSDWVNGKTYPRIDKIELLANYFHISKANLVEDHTTLNQQGVEDAQLTYLFHQLTPANKDVVRATINALLSAQSK